MLTTFRDSLKGNQTNHRWSCLSLNVVLLTSAPGIRGLEKSAGLRKTQPPVGSFLQFHANQSIVQPGPVVRDFGVTMDAGLAIPEHVNRSDLFLLTAQNTILSSPLGSARLSAYTIRRLITSMLFLQTSQRRHSICFRSCFTQLFVSTSGFDLVITWRQHFTGFRYHIGFKTSNVCWSIRHQLVKRQNTSRIFWLHMLMFNLNRCCDHDTVSITSLGEHVKSLESIVRRCTKSLELSTNKTQTDTPVSLLFKAASE